MTDMTHNKILHVVSTLHGINRLGPHAPPAKLHMNTGVGFDSPGSLSSQKEVSALLEQ